MNVTLKILCSLFYILYPMNFQLKVRSKWFWQNWSLFLSFKIFHCKTGIYRMKVDDGPNPTVYIRSWSLQEIKKNVAFFEHSFVLSQFLHNYRYRISSYSFRGNYSFLDLEIQRSQYINVRKLFKGGNYSRAEIIWGNTVRKYLQLTFYDYKMTR